jgi:hypothetical protein
MRLWNRKKKDVKISQTTVMERQPTTLERLCSDDSRLYEDLSHSMYLHPRSHGTFAYAMEKAIALEKEGKINDAARAYLHAGALALYEGDVGGVKRTFDKSAELSGRKFPRIREVPEKAVDIVRQYYEIELKPEEVKK